MVPSPTAKQNALAPKKKLHRNRRWDCEYDIYIHLQEKNRVLKSETEKSNYFHNLLQDFDVKDRKGDSELVQFMNGFYGNIVQSRLFHLDQNPNNIENTAEENGTNDDDDDDDVMVDPQHMYFMDHVRSHGKSYVLDIPEDGVFVVYEPDQSSIPENTATITTDYSNHVSNEEVNVCLDTEMHVNVDDSNRVVKHRGRKPKGAKLSAATNGNVKGSDVASKSKPKKHVYNLKGRRRSKRLKLKAPPESPGSRTLVIEDSDDEAEDLTRSMRGQIVEHCWQEYKYNEANASTLFREKLMEELKAPYCEEEYKRLLHDITIQKPIQHHRDLRGGIKIYEKPDLGKSFLGYHVDLAMKIKTVRDDHFRVLNLMRGFFYWLKNLSHEGAFPPWRDPSCLNVLPQQLEG
ncbi:hypothetical protein GYH30_015258 [Glycine max]|nr:hypothetical protein JHK87_015343 [Glycine soja]KAH1126142.1 hypothetical protein GYH30_015258 [Glycine max]KAH1126144.1 hypothetical protein GYH30_015258 [Glycine max]KAH1126145.1 hypothetical protein GYH30_015258 [Glycine max]KAH1126146.1 hypothetical protein GYH30_015258 [Glycine max]